MMQVIELAQHGVLVPFVFTSRSYTFSVTPDSASFGQTREAVEAYDRAKFLATVAADKADAAAKQAQDDADWEAGVRPY